MQIDVEQFKLVWRYLKRKHIVFGLLENDVVDFLSSRPVNSVVLVIGLNDEFNVFEHF